MPSSMLTRKRGIATESYSLISMYKTHRTSMLVQPQYFLVLFSFTLTFLLTNADDSHLGFHQLVSVNMRQDKFSDLFRTRLVINDMFKMHRQADTIIHAGMRDTHSYIYAASIHIITTWCYITIISQTSRYIRVYESSLYVISFKGRLWFRTKTCLNYLFTTHNHFLIAFPFSHANFGLNSNLCIKPLPAGV